MRPAIGIVCGLFVVTDELIMCVFLGHILADSNEEARGL